VTTAVAGAVLLLSTTAVKRLDADCGTAGVTRPSPASAAAARSSEPRQEVTLIAHPPCVVWTARAIMSPKVFQSAAIIVGTCRTALTTVSFGAINPSEIAGNRCSVGRIRFPGKVNAA
jgi:hypothetical protein